MTTLRRTNVRGIIFKDGKLLVTKFRQDDDQEPDWWGTFGGGLDPNEPILEGLYREMIEETGVAPKIGNLLFIQQFHDGEKEQFELFFHITNAEDYQSFSLEDTSHGALELVRHAFVDPKTNDIYPQFLSQVDIQAYIDGKQPVYVFNELPTTLKTAIA